MLICGWFLSASSAATADDARRIRYEDLSPAIRRALGPAGESEQHFAAYIAGVEAESAQRVAEGEREHLIYYALQSERFTRRRRIEPALSARRFVNGLSPNDRRRLLADPSFEPRAGLPPDERARFTDLLTVLREPSTDPRLAYFRELLRSMASPPSPDEFYPDYVRVTRFLYLKEFVAPRDAAEVARLYQSRPHSSDTQIDAGFGVSTGFGVLKALDPAFRIERVLVVGPGLDLAPRTDLIDAADPQSYQPLAVADALLSLSLASPTRLRVHSVDVNPRVVRAVERLGQEGVTWHLFSGITETPERPLSAEYHEYVRRLGRAIGEEETAPGSVASNRHYQHSIAVRASVSKTFSAEVLNVITQRLPAASVDCIVATNVLPYFDDRQLALALANFAAMLRPGGYLLHNESRENAATLAESAGLPVAQMRTAILGGPPAHPLYDVIWIHQRP